MAGAVRASGRGQDGTGRGGWGGSRKRARVSSGRALAVLGLLGFFVVATGVIARRTFGISQSRSLRALERQRDATDALRLQLESEIRDASSRARLVPIAEQRLHMYVPADSQVIILQRPVIPTSKQP